MHMFMVIKGGGGGGAPLCFYFIKSTEFPTELSFM